jgi:hypothetical protein
MPTAAGQRVVNAQGDGQEVEEENVGAEDHARSAQAIVV